MMSYEIDTSRCIPNFFCTYLINGMPDGESDDGVAHI
jgi:hypothetical protein